MDSESEDYELALENLRIGVKFFIKRLGKLGLVRVVREVIYILQDEGYGGVSALLQAIEDYCLEEGDNAPNDVRLTWRRVARQIAYVVRETLSNGRELH